VLTPPAPDALALKARVKHLRALLDSRGWAILHEVMQEEVVSAAMAIASSANMSIDEINFRRGSIWAAKQLDSLPQTLLARAESDLALATAMTVAPPNPAKAGQE
jgi:hypothetical protein